MNTSALTSTIVIGSRFTGPPRSGNGGYTAGRLAGLVPGLDPAEPHRGVRVTLRLPPPLEVELRADLAADDAERTARVWHGAQLVAEAEVVDTDLAAVEAVTLADACEAEREFAGLRSHPFPTCFSCGPERDPGDGLRLAPGPVPGRRTACTWTPDASVGNDQGLVDDAVVWAALDCPGGWSADLENRPMVLGRITAQIDARVRVGERHVVMGQLVVEEGRKTSTASTIYDSDGRVVARAEHVWVAVDVAAFG